jgi:hypothetical protein
MPYFQNLQRVCKVVIGLIEQHMSKSCTNYGADHKGPQQGIEQFKWLVLPAEEMPEHIIAQVESYNEKDAVIAELEASYIEYYGTHIPVY